MLGPVALTAYPPFLCLPFLSRFRSADDMMLRLEKIQGLEDFINSPQLTELVQAADKIAPLKAVRTRCKTSLLLCRALCCGVRVAVEKRGGEGKW